MKNNYLIFVVYGLFAVSGCVKGDTLLNPQDWELARIKSCVPFSPSAQWAVKSPGFWISLLPDPDRVVLDKEAVELFNLRTEDELKLREDLTKIGLKYPGTQLSNSLKQDITSFMKRFLFDRQGKRVEKGFYEGLQENMNIKAIPANINVRFAFTWRYADIRLLPSEETITVLPSDLEFDELQNDSLDIGVPLAVLQESKDKVWAYIKSSASSGWVRKDRLVFCSLDEFKDFLSEKPFVVVTSPKADIFLDERLTRYHDLVRMGARFACKEKSDSAAIEIIIPYDDGKGNLLALRAFIRKEDVSLGYLAYTQRNIIEQAFKMLNQPYGWGGANREQDCSSFLQEVFSTVGVALPRNSSAQGKTGHLLGSFPEKVINEVKIKILKQAQGGTTICQLRGHVLLYLGMYCGVPFAIHETSAGGAVNKAIVSDLFSGKSSKKGSLIERIVSIRAID